MKKKQTEKIMEPAYSSYHGKVHMPYITTKPQIFSDEGIYMNSVCAGHVVADRRNPNNSGPTEATDK